MAISASLGVACAPQSSGEADVVAMADKALYSAKQSGRNCVRAAAERREAAEAPKVARIAAAG